MTKDIQDEHPLWDSCISTIGELENTIKNESRQFTPEGVGVYSFKIVRLSNGTATISANIDSCEIVIVKIGEKSVKVLVK